MKPEEKNYSKETIEHKEKPQIPWVKVKSERKQWLETTIDRIQANFVEKKTLWNNKKEWVNFMESVNKVNLVKVALSLCDVALSLKCWCCQSVICLFVCPLSWSFSPAQLSKKSTWQNCPCPHLLPGLCLTTKPTFQDAFRDI